MEYEELCLVVRVPGRPGYAAIGMDYPDVRRDFEKDFANGKGTIEKATRSEAVRGFNEYADAKVTR